jgi:hypothetical protein
MRYINRPSDPYMTSTARSKGKLWMAYPRPCPRIMSEHKIYRGPLGFHHQAFGIFGEDRLLTVVINQINDLLEHFAVRTPWTVWKRRGRSKQDHPRIFLSLDLGPNDRTPDRNWQTLAPAFSAVKLSSGPTFGRTGCSDYLLRITPAKHLPEKRVHSKHS